MAESTDDFKLNDLLHGRILGMHLMTNDLENAKSFYTSVLNWDVHQLQRPGADRPAMRAEIDEEPVAGIFSIPETAPSGVAPAWRVLIAVKNVHAAAKTVTDLGGELLYPVTEQEGGTTFCIIRDPQGAVAHLVELSEEDARMAHSAISLRATGHGEDDSDSEDENELATMRHFQRILV